MPTAVTTPFSSNSASVRLPRAFSTILPRGILILNARSRRKTMSRKSIDSASSPSISETSSLMSATSQPSASAIVAATVGNTALISSLVISDAIVASLHFEAAIDIDDLAGDVVGEARGEEPDRVGHFLRLAISLEQDARRDGIARHLAHVLRHFRLDHARRHRVDRDPARRELDRQRTGERIDGALARRVVGLAATALLARHGTQVDDLARALDDHLLRHRADDDEHATDIRV